MHSRLERERKITLSSQKNAVFYHVYYRELCNLRSNSIGPPGLAKCPFQCSLATV